MRISDWSSDVCSSDLDFIYNPEDDSYLCPGGNRLRRSNRNFSKPRPVIDKDGSIRYRSRPQYCQGCVHRQDRKRGEIGKGVTIRVYLGGRLIIKKLNTYKLIKLKQVIDANINQ